MVTFSVRLLVRHSVQLRIDEITGEIGLELKKTSQHLKVLQLIVFTFFLEADAICFENRRMPQTLKKI